MAFCSRRRRSGRTSGSLQMLGVWAVYMQDHVHRGEARSYFKYFEMDGEESPVTRAKGKGGTSTTRLPSMNQQWSLLTVKPATSSMTSRGRAKEKEPSVLRPHCDFSGDGAEQGNTEKEKRNCQGRGPENLLRDTRRERTRAPLQFGSSARNGGREERC